MKKLCYLGMLLLAACSSTNSASNAQAATPAKEGACCSESNTGSGCCADKAEAQKGSCCDTKAAPKQSN